MNDFAIIDNIYSLYENGTLRAKVTYIKQTDETFTATTYVIIDDSTRMLCQKIKAALKYNKDDIVILADPHGFSNFINDWLVKEGYNVIISKLDHADVSEWNRLHGTSLSNIE